ncbi:MAG: Dps family protein [Lautropia sp.]
MAINIGIPNKDRQAVVKLLQPLLADMVSLYFATRGAHWNVVGPNFGPLHAFFEEQYDMIDEEMDQVAERIRSLGEPAPSTLSGYVKSKRIADDAGEAKTAKAMLTGLLAAHEALIRNLREDADASSKHGDEGTADFLTGLMEAHEKMAWMLRAHIE